MTRNPAYLLRRRFALITGLLIVVLAALAACPRTAAHADEMETLKMTAYELQQEIELRQSAYAAAREEVDRAASEIEDLQGRISKLEQEIPKQQERSGNALREQYKFQQQSAGIVGLLLGAETFHEFIAGVEYMSRISDANADEIDRLSQLKSEIVAERDNLRTAQHDAEAKAEEARSAMEAAQEAQAEVQRRIEEEARLQAEIAAQAKKLAEKPRSNDSGSPASGGEGAVENPAKTTSSSGDESASSATSEAASDSGSDAADDRGSADAAAAEPTAEESAAEAPAEVEEPAAEEPAATEEPAAEELSAEDAYVKEWSARIDAYLAGSPLAGQGKTFARAAYAYGVDPRFSPAISFTESSKGLYCSKSHNAWGWGSSSWGSWEEAINAHVAGLARGYGGQISISGAKKYCPPNWKAWYDRTLAQMEMI